jgi:16S rRNA G1207 methylase RsmC
VKRKGPRREHALPPPGPQAFAALGPYARTRLTVRALGLSLPLDVPADVFSTQRIDEGTQLLLGHLPAAPPGELLEVGCGYGALGLPVAARFPQARALLLDRDLLAVAACAHNARQLGLQNAQVVPGLGYRDLPAGASFDWVLCNVPARIGAPFIGHLLAAGQALLRPGGELRVVVIRDLEPAVEDQARDRGLHALARAVRGPRHSVYSLPAAPGAPAPPLDDEALYARDQTTLQLAPGQALSLSRPHDASEDPQHAHGLAMLLEALPRSPPRAALAFRCGYGALALALRARYPEARVLAQERDLLDAAFARRNARALGLSGSLLEVVEALFPADAARGTPCDLVVGELSSSAGEPVAALELRQAAACLAPQGQALVLATTRQERDWLPAALPRKAAATVLVRRGGFSLLRLARPAAG